MFKDEDLEQILMNKFEEAKEEYGQHNLQFRGKIYPAFNDMQQKRMGVKKSKEE